MDGVRSLHPRRLNLRNQIRPDVLHAVQGQPLQGLHTFDTPFHRFSCLLKWGTVSAFAQLRRFHEGPPSWLWKAPLVLFARFLCHCLCLRGVSHAHCAQPPYQQLPHGMTACFLFLVHVVVTNCKEVNPSSTRANTYVRPSLCFTAALGLSHLCSQPQTREASGIAVVPGFPSGGATRSETPV